jgi:cytochrome c553
MKKLISSAVFFSVLMTSPVHAADIEAKYAQSCATCHGAGVLGAPKKGDNAAWEPRLKTRVQRHSYPALLMAIKICQPKVCVTIVVMLTTSP